MLREPYHTIRKLLLGSGTLLIALAVHSQDNAGNTLERNVEVLDEKY